jgi:hypothetical protein
MLCSPDLSFTSKIPSTSNPSHGGQVGAEASAVPWADLDGARRLHRAPVAAHRGRSGSSCGARRRARCSWPSAPSRRRRTDWRGPPSRLHARGAAGTWRLRNGRRRLEELRGSVEAEEREAEAHVTEAQARRRTAKAWRAAASSVGTSTSSRR